MAVVEVGFGLTSKNEHQSSRFLDGLFGDLIRFFMFVGKFFACGFPWRHRVLLDEYGLTEAWNRTNHLPKLLERGAVKI